MTDPRLEDHLVGLELQLVELVEQQHLAETQYRPEDAVRLGPQITAVQHELAAGAEAAMVEPGSTPTLEPAGSGGNAEPAGSGGRPQHADVLAPTVEQILSGTPPGL